MDLNDFPPLDEITAADAIEYLKRFILAVGIEEGVDRDDLGRWKPIVALYVLEREILSWAEFAQK